MHRTGCWTLRFKLLNVFDWIKEGLLFNHSLNLTWMTFVWARYIRLCKQLEKNKCLKLLCCSELFSTVIASFDGTVRAQDYLFKTLQKLWKIETGTLEQTVFLPLDGAVFCHITFQHGISVCMDGSGRETSWEALAVDQLAWAMTHTCWLSLLALFISKAICQSLLISKDWLLSWWKERDKKINVRTLVLSGL